MRYGISQARLARGDLLDDDAQRGGVEAPPGEPRRDAALAVHDALTSAVQEAEAALLRRLDGVTLAALSRDFHQRLLARGAVRHRPEEHFHDEH